MIRRNPKASSTFELRRLSVVLFASTKKQGSSKYIPLKREQRANINRRAVETQQTTQMKSRDNSTDNYL
jgi:hypothetical protein